MFDIVVAGSGADGHVQYPARDLFAYNEFAFEVGACTRTARNQFGRAGLDDEPGRRAVAVVEMLTGGRRESDADGEPASPHVCRHAVRGVFTRLDIEVLVAERNCGQPVRGGFDDDEGVFPHECRRWLPQVCRQSAYRVEVRVVMPDGA